MNCIIQISCISLDQEIRYKMYWLQVLYQGSNSGLSERLLRVCPHHMYHLLNMKT